LSELLKFLAGIDENIATVHEKISGDGYGVKARWWLLRRGW
jgi:hypothetical protein